VDISVEEKFGNRLRVRVCGICIHESAILMVHHQGLREGPFWAPPGGGMEYGVPAAANLEREFLEETGLEVRTGQWLFATEFIQSPLHAVELFFLVDRIGGSLRAGYDPEMGPSLRQAPTSDPIAIGATADRQGGARTSGRRPSRTSGASATTSGRSGQLIREVRFMSFEEVDALPPDARHGAFRLVPSAKNIVTLKGYHRI
jgi:8-oxo-dGTP diphosphatase